MTKKVGRNDPCPCGSGKKYKKCCEVRLAHRKPLHASILGRGMSSGASLQGRAAKISADFFHKPPALPLIEEPRKPEEDEPKHPPEADRPM
jgi:hypothetical protein